jgi:hypothetical protein
MHRPPPAAPSAGRQPSVSIVGPGSSGFKACTRNKKARSAAEFMKLRLVLLPESQILSSKMRGPAELHSEKLQ